MTEKPRIFQNLLRSFLLACLLPCPLQVQLHFHNHSLLHEYRELEKRITMMNYPQADKVVRRVTMVATITASYFLLTADYGPEPNVLDPVKKGILSAESTVKEYIFGSKKESQDSQIGKLDSNKEHP